MCEIDSSWAHQLVGVCYNFILEFMLILSGSVFGVYAYSVPSSDNPHDIRMCVSSSLNTIF